MSDINQAAEDLFFKLRNRFPKIKLGDENGMSTIDPTKSRFFNFTYTDKKKSHILYVQNILEQYNTNIITIIAFT